MKLHQLKALVAIHQAGSILEASKTLHITQPALVKIGADCWVKWVQDYLR